MIEEFSKKDLKYQAYAYSICNCNDRKRDLVNEMYLKLHYILSNDPSKTISDGYIFLMLCSIFLNEKKKNRLVLTEIQDIIEDETCQRRYQANDILCEMDFVDREILLKTQEESLRTIADKVGVHYCTINNQKQSALKKFKRLWQQKQAS